MLYTIKPSTGSKIVVTSVSLCKKILGISIPLSETSISNADELGKQFEIGHTFFAEIVDIYSSFKAINNKTNRIKDKLFRANGPASILWDISIQPILEAYLGNVEEDEKKKTIQDLNNTFFKASLE